MHDARNNSRELAVAHGYNDLTLKERCSFSSLNLVIMTVMTHLFAYLAVLPFLITSHKEQLICNYSSDT